jgi:hypothetical protein
VPLTDSYEPVPTDPTQPYDYFHVNAVEPEPDGSLLVSARNTWTAYKLDPRTGAAIWRLGGKRSSFTFASDAAFAFQHDVRMHGDGGELVTVFDDGAGPPRVHAQSRSLTLRLNTERMVATVATVDEHSPSLLATYQGNVQLLPDGHQFVGWGSQPSFSEFDAQGRMVFDGRFVNANSNYRAYRFQWHATPRTLPAVVTSNSGSSTTVYVSWNGATEVQSWRVLAGSHANAVHTVTTTAKEGFETGVTIGKQPYVEVQALDGSGRVLATSVAVRSE